MKTENEVNEPKVSNSAKESFAAVLWLISLVIAVIGAWIGEIWILPGCENFAKPIKPKRNIGGKSYENGKRKLSA